jgi:hypothetical protein
VRTSISTVAHAAAYTKYWNIAVGSSCDVVGENQPSASKSMFAFVAAPMSCGHVAVGIVFFRSARRRLIVSHALSADCSDDSRGGG